MKDAGEHTADTAPYREGAYTLIFSLADGVLAMLVASNESEVVRALLWTGVYC